jgi:hypothetical protein
MPISMRPKKGIRPRMSKFELELKRATKTHKRKYLAWKPRPRVERRVEEKPAEEKPAEEEKLEIAPPKEEKPPVEEEKPIEEKPAEEEPREAVEAGEAPSS